MTVDLLSQDECAAFVQHLRLHMRENGDNGVAFAPMEASAVFDTPAQLQSRMRLWGDAMRRPISRPEWMRVWAVHDPAVSMRERDLRPDGGIVGHVELRGGGMTSQLHRCRLGMGLYAGFRARGLGRELVDEAIAWATGQSGLDWIDLSVFSHNLAARHLYGRVGFVETGTTVDSFRVAGGSVDDVQMVLKLR